MTIVAWVRSVHKIFLLNINVAKSFVFSEKNNNTNGVKFRMGVNTIYAILLMV